MNRNIFDLRNSRRKLFASKEKDEERKMKDKDRKQKESHQKRLERQNSKGEAMKYRKYKDLESENKE